MNNALDGYAAVVAENEKLRARIKELESATARRCAEIADNGVMWMEIARAIRDEFKLKPK